MFSEATVINCIVGIGYNYGNSLHAKFTRDKKKRSEKSIFFNFMTIEIPRKPENVNESAHVNFLHLLSNKLKFLQNIRVTIVVLWQTSLPQQ
jgi:hypothetical protein